jgi:chromosome segregation ATPase
MTGNRFTLSSIAFGVSFGITLGLSQGNFLGAIGSGSLAFLSSQIGCIIASRQPTDSDDEELGWRIEEVRGHIRSLQNRRAAAYDDLTQLSQERDQVSATLRALQGQMHQLQSKNNLSGNLSSNPSTNPSQPVSPSWNLSKSSTQRTMAEIQSSEALIKNSEAQIMSLEREEADLTRSLSATLSTQQWAEAQLSSTTTELNQLMAQVAEQKANKIQILNEITQLETDRKSIKKELETLQADVQSLDLYRQELSRLAQSTEPVRDQVTAGTASLQTAITQLQDQIGSLHGELETLETQILDRRTQKNSLDLELVTLRTQKENAESTNLASFEPRQDAIVVNNKSNGRSNSKSNGKSNASSDSTAPVELDFSQEPNLDATWAKFATLLLKNEVEALIAIARHASPAQRLKQIAEANLTMPELLIDSINERALEVVGDIILEPSAQHGVPVIAQEYEGAIQSILRAYDRTQKAEAEA